MNRTILEDSWLRLLYVLDDVGVRHYEPVGSMFRAGDEVHVTRTPSGLAVEGYGMREVWAPLVEPQEEAA
jgi:hypothetical protein